MIPVDVISNGIVGFFFVTYLFFILDWQIMFAYICTLFQKTKILLLRSVNGSDSRLTPLEMEI